MSPCQRIEREKRTITAMLAIYCKDHHGRATGLCEDCEDLLTYARSRLDNCPFQAVKPACNHCEVHCYSRRMQERVKAVMRYAGPRMTLRHPLLSLFHLVDKLREIPARPAKAKAGRPGNPPTKS
jgi:hypothetical protein